MRGRIGKPTALKVLQGNPGHRKIDTLHEPQPVIGLGEPPAHLDELAKKLWFELGPQLVKLKTLGESDATLFALMCQAHSRNVWLSSRIDELRAKSTLTGKQENRLLTYESQRAKAAQQYQRISAEFGLGAASRTRIRVHHDDGQISLPGIVDNKPDSPLTRSMAAARSA
jgi:P27 family predicted phage terminase small subunit